MEADKVKEVVRLEEELQKIENALFLLRPGLTHLGFLRRKPVYSLRRMMYGFSPDEAVLPNSAVDIIRKALIDHKQWIKDRLKTM